MSGRLPSQTWVALVLIGLAQLVFAASSKLPEVTEDGLELKKVKGIDVVYVRPGATLAPYKRVMLDPVQVAFSKDWDPEKTGSRMKLSAEDREKIRTGLATLFEKTFKEELEKKGGYPVVTEAAPDVLRLSAALIDVYANAPDVMTPGRSTHLYGERRPCHPHRRASRFRDRSHPGARRRRP